MKTYLWEATHRIERGPMIMDFEIAYGHISVGDDVNEEAVEGRVFEKLEADHTIDGYKRNEISVAVYLEESEPDE